ncbi:MAG: class I SAM-dependent methyltransferase [Cyanobacteria bacterium P01_C01_bin.72]
MTPAPQCINCPVCNSLVEAVLYDLSDGKLMQCSSCRLVSYSPRPSKKDLDEYYNSSTYRKNYEDGEMTGIEFAHTRYKQFIKALINYQPGLKSIHQLRLLDFGCGTGDFLLAAQMKGWQLNGVEVSPLAVEKANQKLGQSNVVLSDFNSINLSKESYDVITSYHVIEHLIKPSVMLNSIFNLLKPGGLVFIETPNIASFGAKIRGSKWSQIMPLEHLNYFMPKSLFFALKQAGFYDIRTTTIRPQKIQSIDHLPNFLRKPSAAMYDIASRFNMGASLQAIATKPIENSCSAK